MDGGGRSRALVLRGPRELAFEPLPSRPLAAGEIRLRTVLSGISHGTELNLYRGSSPFADRVFDRDLRAFVPAEGGGGDFPARLGYELVGEVAEAGEGVDGLAVGDLLHAGAPHGEETVLDVAAAADTSFPPVLLPPGPRERWLFVSLGAVALQAVHDAAIKVGDRVAVVGLGAIGLLLVQLARLNGAGMIHAVDPVPERRALALELGADHVHDPAVAGGAGLAIKRVEGVGADVAVETSGVEAGLQDAIASAVLGGLVVAVGFYQGGGTLRLGEEWHHNRLTMRSSMGAWASPHRSAPAWDRPRIMRTVVDLLA